MSTTSQWWSLKYTGLTNSGVTFIPVTGSNGTSSGTEASEGGGLSAAAGSVKSIYVKLSAAPGVGTSYQFQLSVNAAASSTINVTISDSATTGSATGAVAISAGDLLTLKVTPTTTPASVDAEIWMEFDPTSANNYNYPGGIGVSLLSASGQLAPLFGAHPNQSSSTVLTRSLCAVPGTITAFYISLQTAPGAGTSWDFIITQNGSEVAATDINIAGTNKVGNLTGLSVAVTAGDYFEFKVKTKTGAAASTRGVCWGTVLVPTTTGLFNLYEGFNATPSATVVNYGPIGQRSNAAFDATEANVQVRSPAILRVKGVNVLLGAAPTSGKSWAFTFRNNTAAGLNTVSIADAATSGGDTTHTDVLAAGDLFDFSVTPTNTPANAVSVLSAFALTTAVPTGGGTGGKGKGGGTGTKNPPGQLKTFGRSSWRLGGRRVW